MNDARAIPEMFGSENALDGMGFLMLAVVAGVAVILWASGPEMPLPLLFGTAFAAGLCIRRMQKKFTVDGSKPRARDGHDRAAEREERRTWGSGGEPQSR